MNTFLDEIPSEPYPLIGCMEPKPTKGFPDGKIRWRMRDGEYILARVKTVEGIREFLVCEIDGYWMPNGEIGRNIMPAQQ